MFKDACVAKLVNSAKIVLPLVGFLIPTISLKLNVFDAIYLDVYCAISKTFVSNVKPQLGAKNTLLPTIKCHALNAKFKLDLAKDAINKIIARFVIKLTQKLTCRLYQEINVSSARSVGADTAMFLIIVFHAGQML